MLQTTEEQSLLLDDRADNIHVNYLLGAFLVFASYNTIQIQWISIPLNVGPQSFIAEVLLPPPKGFLLGSNARSE